MRAIGLRYRLFFGIVAEVYKTGKIVLARGNIREVFDSLSEAEAEYKLFAELGAPSSLAHYVCIHGRPCGTIWEPDPCTETKPSITVKPET